MILKCIAVELNDVHHCSYHEEAAALHHHFFFPNLQLESQEVNIFFCRNSIYFHNFKKTLSNVIMILLLSCISL
jgi:hypothetical protein